MPNIDLVHAAPKDNDAVRYLGSFDNVDACENACGSDEWCKAYTWNTPESNENAKKCYGSVLSTSQQSGVKESFNPNIQTAITFMSRKLGSQSAGK